MSAAASDAVEAALGGGRRRCGRSGPTPPWMAWNEPWLKAKPTTICWRPNSSCRRLPMVGMTRLVVGHVGGFPGVAVVGPQHGFRLGPFQLEQRAHVLGHRDVARYGCGGVGPGKPQAGALVEHDGVHAGELPLDLAGRRRPRPIPRGEGVEDGSMAASAASRVGCGQQVEAVGRDVVAERPERRRAGGGEVGRHALQVVEHAQARPRSGTACRSRRT